MARNRFIFRSDDAKATREFELRNILIGYCGTNLTAGHVDRMVKELIETIESGPGAWAFKALAN
jgi:hypothetical protein